MNILTPDNCKTTCPHIKCAGCNDWECRCGDCIALIEKDGELYCDLDNKCCNEKWYYAKFRDNNGFKVVDGESFYAETDDGMTQKWFY